MRQSGLADLLPSLRETVYVGVSAGSVVGCSMFPHLDRENMPDNSMVDAETWAAGIAVPAYAIDDQTATQLTDGTVEVVSERHWKRFIPQYERLSGFARDV